MEEEIRNLMIKIDMREKVQILADRREIIGDILLFCISPKILITFDSEDDIDYIILEAIK